MPAQHFTNNETMVCLIQAGMATIILMVSDLTYRGFRNRELGWKRFFLSNAGGHICAIPIWTYVPVMIIIGIVSLFVKGK